MEQNELGVTIWAHSMCWLLGEAELCAQQGARIRTLGTAKCCTECYRLSAALEAKGLGLCSREDVIGDWAPQLNNTFLTASRV